MAWRCGLSAWRWGAVCLALVAAAGGCSGANGLASRTGAGGTASPSPEPATRVVTVDPWTRDGLARRYTATGESPGTCLPSGTSSRADAFRCFDADDQVFDPCLADRYAETATRLACPLTSRKVHIVNVSGELEPNPGGTAPEQGDIWMATLKDGTLCHSSTGAGPGPREGLEVRMYCPDGTLWGPLDSSAALWTVRRAKSETGPLGTATVKEVFR